MRSPSIRNRRKQRSNSIVATTIACVLVSAPISRAQENGSAPEPANESSIPASQPAGPPPTPLHTGLKELVKGIGRSFVQLPSKENLFWAIGGGAGALAAHQADDFVQQHLVDNPEAEAFFKPGRVIGVVIPSEAAWSHTSGGGYAISPGFPTSGRI